MDLTAFTSTWAKARDILAKRGITDEYILHNSKNLNIQYWREEVVKALFDELMASDPGKVDLSSNAIRDAYWRFYGKIFGHSAKKYEECSLSLCDGYGWITLDVYQNNTKTFAEYGYRCSCKKGNELHHDIPMFQHRILNEKVKLKFDMKELKRDEFLGQRQITIEEALKRF